MVITILFSLCACGGHTTSTQSGTTNSTEPTIEKNNETEIIQKPEGIRENGKLSNEDLTDEEFKYYFSLAINALIKLDLETLKPLILEDEYNALKKVSDDENLKNLWDKTFGQSLYMEESYMLIGKSPLLNVNLYLLVLSVSKISGFEI